jgi:DNA replication protein DnaC
MSAHPPLSERVTALLTTFGLTTAAQECVSRLTQAGHAAALPVLHEILDLERAARQHRRIDGSRRASRLPPGKTSDALDATRFPAPLMTRLHELAEGHFLATATNVLAFGFPGVGKSHAMAALGHALV